MAVLREAIEIWLLAALELDQEQCVVETIKRVYMTEPD